MLRVGGSGSDGHRLFRMTLSSASSALPVPRDRRRTFFAETDPQQMTDALPDDPVRQDIFSNYASANA